MEKVKVPNQLRVTGLPVYKDLENKETERKKKAKEIATALRQHFPGSISARSSPTKGFAYVAFPNEDAFKEALKLDRSEITVDNHSYPIRVGQLYKNPNGEKQMSDAHAKPHAKPDAHAKSGGQKGSAKARHKKPADDSIVDKAKHIVHEGVEIVAGYGFFASLERLIRWLLGSPKGADLATKAAEAAAKALQQTMKEKLRRKEDDWLHIIAAMTPSSARKLTAWLGDQEKVNKGFRKHFMDTFVDHITADVPKNDKGLPELDKEVIEKAARLLESFIEAPVTPGPIGNQDRINRARGMVGHQRRNPMSGARSLLSSLEEARRQVNHAIDPNNPHYQPRQRTQRRPSGHDTSNDEPIRLY